MSIVITDLGSNIEFTFSGTPNTQYLLNKATMRLKQDHKLVYVTNATAYNQAKESKILELNFEDVVTPSYADNDELYAGLKAMLFSGSYVVIADPAGGVLTLEPNNSIPVTLQDQHTPTVITKMSILEETTIITAPVAINDTVITVASANGIETGKYLSLFDVDSVRFMNAYVISVDTLDVTIDRPIDFAFPSNSYVDVSETNLAQDGTLAAPIIAGVRNNAGAEPPPGIALSFDVTRVLFHCVGTSSMNLTTFGNLSKLTNGIVLRKRDGDTHNIFNCKSNGEMKGIMFDFDIVQTGTVGQGEDGFFGRLTFGGQSKMGVTIRLAINEDLELFIQDLLAGLTLLEIEVEGSIVEP